MKDFIRRLLNIEPEVIRVEVPKYIQVKQWSQEICGILTDIKWEKGCIDSREQRPELYESNEDVPAVIEETKAHINELLKRLVAAL